MALAGAAALALVGTATLSAAAPAAGPTTASVENSVELTAAKKKPKKAKAYKSCGTYKYPDKKTGKCVDARDKKK